MNQLIIDRYRSFIKDLVESTDFATSKHKDSLIQTLIDAIEHGTLEFNTVVQHLTGDLKTINLQSFYKES